MKNLCVLLTLLISANIFAQESRKINFQFTIGPTITMPYKSKIEKFEGFEEHPITEYKSNAGFGMEFIAQFNISEKYAITSGINYNYLRLKIVDKIGLFESKGNLTNSYLQIPILFRSKLSRKWSFYTGVYTAYLINAKESGTTYVDVDGLAFPEQQYDPAVNSEMDYNNDVKEGFKKLDFGLSSKLEYEMNKNSKLTSIICIGLNYGLTNTLTNNILMKSAADEWKNINLMVGAGVKF